MPSRTYRRTGARLAFGKSITVDEDEEVTDGVVAIGGRIRIAGRVRDEVVAIGGSVELLPTADVRGDITADRRAGDDRAGGAPCRRGASGGGARLARLASGRLLGWSWIDLGGTARWLTLAGTLTRVGLLAAAVSLVMLLAGARIGRIADAATAAPFRAGVIGLSVQLLFVPVLVVLSIGLAVTIIGIPFVAILDSARPRDDVPRDAARVHQPRAHRRRVGRRGGSAGTHNRPSGWRCWDWR